VISEPELTSGAADDDGRPPDIVTAFDKDFAGGFGAGPGTDFAAGSGADFDDEFGGDFGVSPGEDFGGAPRPVPRPRPPWMWILGAVLATSAVWAAGTQAYDRAHSDRPELHGYRIGANPCVGPPLDPLVDAFGAYNNQGSPAQQHTGAAIDRIHCDFSARAPYAQGGTTTYTVGVSVDLHKRVDPRAEFDDQVRLEDGSLSPADTVSSVPELGDEAYFLTRGDQGQELKVLHGGAVFTLVLNAYSDVDVADDTLNGLGGGPYELSPDLTQYQPALIRAVRNIMSALRHA
jgi:hypothetical protein